MVCSPCLRRSALVAAVAPAIARCSLRHHSLLSLLGASEDRLLRAARVQDPPGVLRGLQLPALTDSVPTALCRHDAGYPRALRQLPTRRLCCTRPVLLSVCGSCFPPASPRVAIVGSRGLTPYAEQITRTHDRRPRARGCDRGRAVSTRGPRGSRMRGRWTGAGRTIAVMACSPDLSHLTRQDSLHQRILATARPYRSSRQGSSNRSAGASSPPGGSSPRLPMWS